jgi:hypothetical protein
MCIILKIFFFINLDFQFFIRIFDLYIIVYSLYDGGKKNPAVPFHGWVRLEIMCNIFSHFIFKLEIKIIFFQSIESRNMIVFSDNSINICLSNQKDPMLNQYYILMRTLISFLSFEFCKKKLASREVAFLAPIHLFNPIMIYF